MIKVSGGVQSAISESKGQFRLDELSQVVYFATDGQKEDLRDQVEFALK